MDFTIVTNNEIVADRYQSLFDVRFHPLTDREILTLVRDFVHKGYRLLSSPLSGSVKPGETPYRSILISAEAGPTDLSSVKLIEHCLDLADRFARHEVMSESVRDDFRLIDFSLLQSALESAASDTTLLRGSDKNVKEVIR